MLVCHTTLHTYYASILYKLVLCSYPRWSIEHVMIDIFEQRTATVYRLSSPVRWTSESIAAAQCFQIKILCRSKYISCLIFELLNRFFLVRISIWEIVMLITRPYISQYSPHGARTLAHQSNPPNTDDCTGTTADEATSLCIRARYNIIYFRFRYTWCGYYYTRVL